jgi:hypothetical protein
VVSLFVSFIVCNPTDNFDVGVDDWFSCRLILVRARVLFCWLFWPLTIVTQSGGCKLTSVVLVEICNLLVEYGHCNVKQVYDNVLNNVVKFTSGL